MTWSEQVAFSRSLPVDPWSSPHWVKTIATIATTFEDDLPSAFCQQPEFDGFGTAIHALARLEHDSRVVQELLKRCPELAVEPTVGQPLPLHDSGLSYVTVHHLHALAQWLDLLGGEDEMDGLRVLEWGGGWGNFARLYRTVVPRSTYVIVDLPFMSLVQWRYLSDVLGPDAVTLMHKPGPIQPGVVTLVPVTFAADLPDVDAFVSMWALSECSQHAHELVAARRWYGAQHLLLGYDATASEAFPDLNTFLELIDTTDGWRTSLLTGIGSYLLR